MPKKSKYLLGFLVIIGVLVYLLSTTFTSSLQYYLTAGELQAKETLYRGKTLKVAGKAANIQQIVEDGKNTYHFNVVEGGASIPISYAGFVPDTFKEGAEVVVTGKLLADGTIQSSEILAKCASKYEAKIKP